MEQIAPTGPVYQAGTLSGNPVAMAAGLATLEVRINDSIAAGCAGFAAGHTGTANLAAGDNVGLHKAQDWERRKPQLIGSDRGGSHV